MKKTSQQEIEEIYGPQEKKPSKWTFKTLFGKLLSLCFGIFWMMIVFKIFNFSFMTEMRWISIFIPVIFFLIASLSYIIILYFYAKFFIIKPEPLSKDHENLIKRRFHLDRKNPTSIQKTASKLLILFISLIIAYLISCLWI